MARPFELAEPPDPLWLEVPPPPHEFELEVRPPIVPVDCPPEDALVVVPPPLVDEVSFMRRACADVTNPACIPMATAAATQIPAIRRFIWLI